jgi:energy-coupling factor transport system ATP-binding protein
VLHEVLISLSPKIKAKDLDNPELVEKAQKLLEDFSLSTLSNRSPWQLSQGEQRRLAVLTMLALKSEILFLDEPTYAQDEISTIHIMELLESRVEKGLAALFVTHDISLARAYASRVMSLEKDGLNLF